MPRKQRKANKNSYRTFEGALKQEQRTSDWSLKRAAASVLLNDRVSARAIDGSASSTERPSFTACSPANRCDPGQSSVRTEDYIHTGNNEIISRSLGYEPKWERRGYQTDDKEVVGPTPSHPSFEQRKIQNEVLGSGERHDYRTTEKTIGVVAAESAA